MPTQDRGQDKRDRRDADRADWYQLFQVQAGRNMYSVSSDGSCGFVTEQSKPLGSKKGQQWHSAFSNFYCLYIVFVHVCITFTACTMCQIHKVENLPKIVVAFLDPKSQSQLWTFPLIFTQEVNDSKISTFLAYFSKESSWSHGCSSWMKYHMTSQTYSSPCFFSAVYCSIARAARRWELDPETS